MMKPLSFYMTIASMDLLKLFKPGDRSYSGNASYRHVERLLKREKNLLIISPYIDDYYASYLLRNSRGKRIYIISSAMREGAVRKLRGRNLGGAARFAFLVAAANAAFLIFGVLFWTFIVISSIAAIAYLLYSFRGSSNIALKVPKGFVHAKMYIGDETAIEGSANLTYQGMHKNIEHIDIISDKVRISDLKKQFMEIWDSL